MRFEVKKRDGPSRIGELVVEDEKAITPNILFVNTSRFKAPDFADFLISNTDRENKKPTLKVLGRMFSSSKNEYKGELEVSNYLVYPKDLPKELHISAIKLNKKRMKNCYVLPANKEIIDESLKDNDASLFIVANARQIFTQRSKFVEFITELRERIGYQRMIYLPCIGDPTSFALLVYMGIDFFDSIAAILAARDNLLLFPTGKYDKYDLEEIPCNCPSCNGFQGKPSEMSFQQILSHNYFALLDEIKQVRNAITMGCLRELVETRVRTSPSLTAILRNLDMSHYDFLEERTPLIRSNQLIATTKEALYRPEIKRFQDRVIKRYRKPESAKILLLLPCSAKKPYSFSKSHKLFRERLHDLRNHYSVHEMIITSPLGIVPRELELTCPASAYDIPVTGFWDEDEKKMIRGLLQQYLEVNTYDKFIMHLPMAIKEFITDLFKNPIDPCVNSIPTSKASLDKLSNVLRETLDSYERIKPSIRMREDVESFASYQFGRKTAEKLLKECYIKGRYPNQKIMYNHKQLGMIIQQRGLISLTLEGAERIVDSTEYWVEIYDDFTLKGSVFAPGVKDADKAIRIGDEVVVLKNGKLCAVGVAQMNGDEMKESSRGEAVKIRHRN